MSESSLGLNSIKYYTKKLNGTNFTTWIRELYTSISLLNLDQYVNKSLESLPLTSDRDQKAKLTNNIIRMHLNGENSARFLDDDEIDIYKPKELWDSICSYYAAKSMENGANLMRTLVAYNFGTDLASLTINDFRGLFKLFVEVTKHKWEKKTVEGLWVYWVLIALPTKFALFKTLKYTKYGKPDSVISMSSFLDDLEQELKRQADPSVSLNALAVSNRQMGQGQSS
ncbi:hypothetical protein PTTG_26354 [Puccinia triticina 1-1 BBBD Race 1]|uniref:Uncharacterized protein n=1 Tax=Puccinia triticina (isolate 1-1 / race 1 (BBBD)) TaxID=630390 RepID=A0A180GU75_PUCT1|nr:hypothetical protein PTTG_26354 [Puccinia triticina 1-1 BBBD Race 1]